MYYATANFKEMEGKLFRFDTKLWFDRPPRGGEGVCVGAVMGLNPGSSQPAKEKGFVTVDPTMGNILAAFERAAENLGRSLPVGAFVRMWNLLYVCDSEEGSAISLWMENPHWTSASYLDKTEKEKAPFLWLAWTAATPVTLAVRAMSRKEPVCWLGMDRKPHYGKMELTDIRHPSRKSVEEHADDVHPVVIYLALNDESSCFPAGRIGAE